MKKTKIMRTAAAITAAVLISGGVYLMFRNDLAQKLSYRRLKPFMPDIAVFDERMPDRAEITDEPDNSARLPEDKKRELTEQVREVCRNFDGSIGWLYIPDTSINYPVMYSGDNDYYLHRAYDGGYLYSGSVFLDGRCARELSDGINILYGHNMRNGSMFADVINFTDESYFEARAVGWLTVSDSVFRIDFFSLSQPECYSGFYDVTKDISVWLDGLKENSFIWKNIGVSEKDKFISLSTCTGAEGASRTVLTGKLTEV